MVKNKLFFSFLLVFAGLISSAQPKKVVADKIIAVVGDKIILQSDIDNQILDMQRQGAELPDDARCLILGQAMAMKAMVLQAEKDSLPVTDEEVEAEIENQIRYFISVYGSKEELEKIAGKSVYQLREDFKEGFRDRKLAGAMRAKIVENVKITPNEVRNFFLSITEDSLAFYETEVEVGVLVKLPKASREAEEYCIEQLNSYKQQIEAGRDFKTLASLYSEDPGSKDRGGLYEVNRNQKDFDPVWIAKAFSLKEGQVSSPFKTRFGYHIVQMVSRAGDDAVVRHILKIPQVTQFEMDAATMQLDSIRNLIVSGKLDFGAAVQKFSDDENGKFTAGLIQGRDGTFLTIDQLDKEMVPVLNGLGTGEFSAVVAFTDERGRKGVRIIYLKTKTDPHRENLTDDYNRISQRALEAKRENEIEKWFDQHIHSYYIFLDDDFKSCQNLQKWLN